MLYCENCMIAVDEKICPRCQTKKIREPQENDPVFLITKPALWSGGIEELLKEHGIPCLKKGALGAGFSTHIGYAFGSYHFFVPYSAYVKANELIKNWR